ncbi:S8 family serine peptidase [Candidatus Bipolaricaulota bacterium]|nr:S8 family serine peptidase [Candidatus Bipolaricaulota bacterium]
MGTKKRNLLTILGILTIALVAVFGSLADEEARKVAGAGGASNASVTLLDASALSWSIERVGAPAAWNITTGSSEIVVAVIDSGIDATLPDLADKLWTNADEIPGNGIDDDRNGYIDDLHGWDFRDNDASSLNGTTIHWHGTFVAGLIVAQPDSNEATGVAPDVRVMDLRFLDTRNQFYGRDWEMFAEAIDYAVRNDADIINLSIYCNGTPPAALEQAIRRADAAGVLVVGIAGNNGRATVCYPGCYPSVIAVSATDRGNSLASFSNYGPHVAVCAPGDSVISLYPGGEIAEGSGTSFAAPHVSAALALILSRNGRLSPEEALACLTSSATDLGTSGPDAEYGSGLIDAGAAVASAISG